MALILNDYSFVHTDQAELEKIVLESYTNKKLIKGYFETIKAIKYSNLNPIDQVVITTLLDQSYETALINCLKAANITIKLVKTKKDCRKLVYNILSQYETEKRKTPFSCKVFCILK